MARMLLVELALPLARCRMACAFCPERYVVDRAWDVAPEVVDEVVAEFAALLADDDRDVYLESADMLEFPGLDRLLDVAHGRRVHVATPGLRLAEPGVAERFVGRDIRFDLTVHGVSEDVVADMTGVPDAGPRIEAAVDRLVALGLDVHLSVVVTARNAGELAATVTHIAARWKPEVLSVKLFWPDSDDGGVARLHPDYLDQFPDLEVVHAQLAALADHDGPLPHVDLYNIPFCQVDPALPTRLSARVLECWNAFRAYPLPQCDGCAAREVCPGIHLHYIRSHRLRRPDPAAIAQVRTSSAGR